MTARILEQALAGEISAADTPDEATYHAIWHQHELGAADPIASALHGGLLAGQLAWVFVAGYQAAIRMLFPTVPSSGWAAYAAAEDPEALGARPGVHATQTSDGWRLSGNKTWIGQSRSIAHLIVTARSGDAETPQSTVMLRADAPGVTLTHREAPGFLGALSQGFAAFDDAVIPAPEPWLIEHVRRFSRLEARFVMLSATGFLISHTSSNGQKPTLASLALALSTACADDTFGDHSMALLDDAYQAARERFEATTDLTRWPDWEADRRLLTMYSNRIQRRVAR